MASVGLSLTTAEILLQFHNRRLLAASLLANFVLVPLFAYLLLFIFPLGKGMATGLIIVSLAAGAPSLPKIAAITRGNVAYAVGLMALLMVATVIYLPLVIPFVLPGVAVDPGATAFSLIVFMLIPLIICLGIRTRYESFAKKAVPAADAITNLSIVAIFLIFGIAFLTRLGDFFSQFTGTGGIVVAVIFILGAWAIGYFTGGPLQETQTVLGFGTGFRNISAALLVVTTNFTEPAIILMVLAITIFGVIIIGIMVGADYRRHLREETNG
ncbi:bile acid:sodium symporter family protein [Methanogenium cariaci]|jgi:predicted Na+-dependent transporter